MNCAFKTSQRRPTWWLMGSASPAFKELLKMLFSKFVLLWIATFPLTADSTLYPAVECRNVPAYITPMDSTWFVRAGQHDHSEREIWQMLLLLLETQRVILASISSWDWFLASTTHQEPMDGSSREATFSPSPGELSIAHDIIPLPTNARPKKPNRLFFKVLCTIKS